MQPARKLLSLLFLILMGTELTQVRASAPFLLRARRPPGPEPAKVGEPLRTARRPTAPARARRIGEGTSCTWDAGEVQADPRLLLCPQDP